MRPGSGAGPPDRTEQGPARTTWFEIADSLYLASLGAATGADVRPDPAGHARDAGSPPPPPPAVPPQPVPDPEGDTDELTSHAKSGDAAGPATTEAATPEAAGVGAGRGTPESAAEARQDLPSAPTRLRDAGAPGRAPARTAPVDLTGGAVLDGTRALARALRPLKRGYPSLTRSELDEAATAEGAAEGLGWLPRMRPTPERWMDAVLVIDTSASMLVWRRPAAEFALMLRRTGAFRDVRVQRLDGDRVTPADARGQASWPYAPARRSDEGRRVVLVLTDAVGAAWHDGSARALLAGWTARAGVAVVQMLSQAVWHRTGLAVHRAPEVRVPGPGAVSAAWRVPGVPGPAVPVLELDPDWLGRWARITAGLEPVAGGTWVTFPHEAPAEQDEPGPPPTPRERVRRFRAEATPAAWALAVRLAAVPLNIPTMEFVLRAGRTAAGPAELAEVMLGGLLCRVGDSPLLDGTAVGYDFEPGVRELLLSAGRRDETRHLLMSALDRQSEGLEPLRALRALVAEPAGAGAPEQVRLTDRVLPYADVQVKVMTAISGPYLLPARALGARIAGLGSGPAGAGGTVLAGEATVRLSDGRDTVRALGDETPEKVPPTAISGQGLTASEVIAMDDPNSPRRPADALTSVQGPGSGSPGTSEGLLKGIQVPPTTVRSGPAATDRRAPTRPRVWNAPTRNASFTGRARQLAELHERLADEGAAAVLPEALHGLGGVGKSQIAIEYIYRHAADYDAVWWIPAERPEQIRQSLGALAAQLGLDTGTDNTAAVKAALDALSAGQPYHRWLLVFDNAEDPDVVRPFFPTSDTGRIVVTSRNAHWARTARTVDVDVFSTSESIELLGRRGPELEPDQAARVAEALGNLPLAIEQAAAWLSETGMPVDEYLAIFEDERADLIQNRSDLLAAGVPVDYPEPVAAAWNMSLKRLSDNNPGALQLLQICSFFAPEPIPRRYFTGVRGLELPHELTEVLRDPIKLGHAIRSINRYALIKLNHRDNTIQMHRLVRAVLVGQMSVQERADMRHGAHALLANSDPNDGAATYWPQYAELLVHARFSHAQDCDDHWVRQMVRHVIRYLNAIGDYDTCLTYGREVLESWNERLGPSDLQALSVARILGGVLRQVGDHAEAEQLDVRSLELLREHHGDEHPGTIATLSSMAQNARLKGDYALALDLERDRWRRAVREFDEGSIDTLSAANDYALALRRVGDYQAALELDTEAREMAERSHGQDSLMALLLASNQSIDIRETGDYLRARDVQERTMARLLLTISPTAPIALIAARALSTARRKAGDHQAAVGLIEETVRAYQRRLRRPNTNVASAVLSLSMALRQNADLEEARKVGKEAWDALRDMLGEVHPYTLTAATDHAITLRLLGDVDEARTINEQASTELAVRLGADHPISLAAAANLASDRYALADFAEAAELDAAALELSSNRLGADHPTTLAIALNHSLDQRALGRTEEATALHADTLARFRRVLGASHPATVGAARGMRADCDAEVE